MQMKSRDHMPHCCKVTASQSSPSTHSGTLWVWNSHGRNLMKFQMTYSAPRCKLEIWNIKAGSKEQILLMFCFIKELIFVKLRLMLNAREWHQTTKQRRAEQQAFLAGAWSDIFAFLQCCYNCKHHAMSAQTFADIKLHIRCGPEMWLHLQSTQHLA